MSIIRVVLFCEGRDTRKIFHVLDTCHRKIKNKTATKATSQTLASENPVIYKFKFGILGQVPLLRLELSVG